MNEQTMAIAIRDGEIEAMREELDGLTAKYALAKNALVQIERWCTLNNRVDLSVYPMACRALNEMGVTGLD